MGDSSGYLAFNGNTIPVLSLSMTTGYEGGLVFIEFFSSMSEAKAINVAIKVASSLAARKQNRTNYEIDGFTFHTGGRSYTLNALDTGYLTVAGTQLEGKRRRAHLALLCAGLTQKASVRRFILDGSVSEPSPWFPKVFQTIRAPVLPEWYPVLWTQGIRKKLLTLPGVCFGRRVWEVAEEEHWQKLVTDLVKDGLVTGKELQQNG